MAMLEDLVAFALASRSKDRILMRMDDTNTLTIIAMRLGDRRDFVAENLPWNGTAEENIERYQREVPTERVDHVKTTSCTAC